MHGAHPLQGRLLPGRELVLGLGSEVRNRGGEFVALTEAEQAGEAPEELRIRGYRRGGDGRWGEVGGGWGWVGRG